MKKCPKCETENPWQANFCRVCGSQFEKNRKTPPINDNQYKQNNNILDSLRPANDNDFVFFDQNGKDNIMVALAAVLLINPLAALIVTGGEGIFLIPIIDVPVIVYIIYKVVRWSIYKTEFKENVDFIENIGPIARIAKENRMGLYERNYRVLLKSQYSQITSFDKNHFLIEKNGKKGIYSTTYKKIIVPVQYDSILPFRDYITIAIINDQQDKYDIKGNKWL